MVKVEICCDGIMAAEKAAAAGADRLELCSDLSCGGVTPSRSDIIAAAGLGVPVNVLVRPRGGDFIYSEVEFAKMTADIEFCAGAGAAGVVIGALDAEGRVDKAHVAPLIAAARGLGLSVTFHRAVDAASDIFAALEDILAFGPDLILTSGGAPSAWEGRGAIAEMVRRCIGSRTAILAGAGITASNALPLVAATGVTQVHGSRVEILKAFL